MVIKGGARGGAANLTQHLQRTDTNERAELRGLRGVAAQDLGGALAEMEAIASGGRSKRHFYHASINTRADEQLTEEQWAQAIDRLEQELGLQGQPRAIVAHLKKGRAHTHVVWLRIDQESMTAIPDSHNYRRHELVSRELEREFGHARVQGVHVEREGLERPVRTASRSDLQQAERRGASLGEATTLLSAAWVRTDNGQSFVTALSEQGWIVARGDRRDFVAIDPSGKAHSLPRRIDGANAADVRARMADVDRATLPSVKEARQSQRELLAAGRDVADANFVLPQPSQPRSSHDFGMEVRRDSPAEEELVKRLGSVGRATPNAGLVAQQHEAQQRFERNSADLEAQRQARLKMINDAIKASRERDRQDQPDIRLERSKGELER